MNQIMRSYLILFLFLILTGCSGEERVENNLPTVHDDNFHSMWAEIIEQSLQDPLWENDNKYDAAASLMLPMHYAFKYQSRFKHDPQLKFDEFFKALYASYDPNTDTNFTRRSQFVYFITQYLKLKSDSSWGESYLTDLLAEVELHLMYIWTEKKAIHWDKSLNLVGVKGRLDWNFSNPEIPYDFYRAVFDEDWFVLAAISDVIAIHNKVGTNSLFDAVLQDSYNHKLITFWGEFKGDKWYFQNGVWWDHPDYSYAGHSEIESGLEFSQVEDLAIDSSHLHRVPLWLKSFTEISSKNDVFSNALEGFRNAFEENVFQWQEDNESGFFVMTNYADGHNGVYRYQFETQGENKGYAPYQLSGTLFIGYYVFMESDVYTQGMKKMASRFPLSGQALATYVGPNTTRTRHPLFVWPDYFENDFAQLFSKLAACYKRELIECEASH